MLEILVTLLLISWPLLCITLAPNIVAESSKKALTESSGRWTPKTLQDDLNEIEINDLHSIGGIEELTILGTVDGFLHGVDRSTNRLLWSTSSGNAMLGTTTAKKITKTPSNDAQRIDNNNESTDNSNNNSNNNNDMIRNSLLVDTIIPTIDGNVLVHTNLLNSKSQPTETVIDDDVFVPSNTMRKTSVTARVLVENTPFISQEGVLFTGQKTSSMVGLDVDLNTGELMNAINSNIHVSKGTSDHNHKNTNAVQQTSPSIHNKIGKHTKPSSSSVNTLWFGRVDYGLRASCVHTGMKHFDMTYGEWYPMLSTLPQAAITDGRPTSIDTLSTDNQFSIVSTPHGDTYFTTEDTEQENDWSLMAPLVLNSPVISAFAVCQNKKKWDGLHSIKEQQYSIRNLKVHHRVRNVDESSTSSALLSKDNLNSNSLRSENLEEVVIVQSSQDNSDDDGMLYAIEMSTADLKGLNWPPISSHFGDSMKKTESGTFALIPHSEDLLESKPSISSIAESIKPGSIGKHSTFLAPVKSPVHARQHRKRILLNEGSLEIIQPPKNEYTEEGLEFGGYKFDDDNNNDDDFLSDDDYISGHAELYREKQQLLEADVIAAVSESSSMTPGLKQGRYKIHSDPYTGGLFTPRQQLLLQNIHLEQQLNRLQTENDLHKQQLLLNGNAPRLLLTGSDDYFSDDVDSDSPASGFTKFSRRTIAKNIFHVAQVIERIFLSMLLLVIVTLSFLLCILLVLRHSPLSIQLPASALILRWHFLMDKALVMVYKFFHIDAFVNIFGFKISFLNSTENSESIVLESKKRSDSTSLFIEYDDFGKKVTKVGSLEMFDSVLGYGSHGTVVFKGSLNGRPVAIKRMLSQFNRAAEREISLLIRSDGHPNVVRYFLKEQKSDFVYLALQLCEMSLKDFITKVRNSQAALPPSNIDTSVPDENANAPAIADEVRSSLLQIAQGIAHLHAQRIVHRDIKPHNILCANPNENAFLNSPPIIPSDNTSGNIESVSIDEESLTLRHLQRYVLKISDMGLSKQLDKDENSFSSYSYVSATLNSTANNAVNSPIGTIGWQAPELMVRRCSSGPSPSPTSSINSSGEVDENNLTQALEDELAMELEEENLIGPLESEEVDESGHTIENLNDLSMSMDDSVLVNPSQSSVSQYKKKKSERQKKINALLALRQKRKRTQTVDIFSLGCVFYYVLTFGEHPFGQWYEREVNIVTGKEDLSLLEKMNMQDAMNLIARMLQTDPLERPTAEEVCLHHFFWSASKRLEFLVDFSDRLEQEPPTSKLVMAVETNAMAVIGVSSGGKWGRKLDDSLLEDMGKYRKYDTNSVRDLLRVIRNKRHHYHELSASVKSIVGALPVGFCSYFDKRFPLLLSHCVEIAKKYLADDRLFSLLFYRDVQFSSSTASSNKSMAINTTNTSTVSASMRTMSTMEPCMTSSSGGVNDSFVTIDETDLDGSGLAVGDNFLCGSDSGRSISSSITATSAPVVCADGVIVWHGSTLQASLKCKGWWRDSSDWVGSSSPGSSSGSAMMGSLGSPTKKNKPSHLLKAASDLKYRTRLCTHWETTAGSGCPMRKKGKCIFAHGPIELRVKETRRDRWGLINNALPNTSSTSTVSITPPPSQISSQTSSITPSTTSTSSSTTTTTTNVEVNRENSLLLLRLSGGEDVLGAARQIEKVRQSDGSLSDFEKQSSSFSSLSSTSQLHFHHHNNNASNNTSNNTNNNGTNHTNNNGSNNTNHHTNGTSHTNNTNNNTNHYNNSYIRQHQLPTTTPLHSSGSHHTHPPHLTTPHYYPQHSTTSVYFQQQTFGR